MFHLLLACGCSFGLGVTLAGAVLFVGRRQVERKRFSGVDELARLRGRIERRQVMRPVPEPESMDDAILWPPEVKR